MDITVKDDARQRIEKVVKEYRETQGKHNYTWEVQDRFAFDDNFLITIIAGSILGGIFIYLDLAGILRYPIWAGIAFSTLTVAFQIVCRLSNRFKEKVWKRDFINDEDILYLCVNSELKENIRDDIAHLGRLTYSFILDKMPVYLGDIEYRRRQASRDALLKKIDEN